ncbi:urease-enhancing factor [Helicobacter pylori]|uniref:urease-enhancing factor n=1 Tax=Helicobacter pylori TaxID=210 RepID=UPI001FD2F83D|nr:urease-enhancing factor [Helicobacter pylori]MCK0498378.1 urease-enhancing factor [Helicobacter pylori]UOS21984.1 urease-enhancing factor [Helicobacter pylori]
MKTIRNSVFIGASLLGGCTSVENYFDALRVASVNIEKKVCYTPKDFYSPYRTD